MGLSELFRGIKPEKLIGKANYIAPCKEINPIELYFLKKGYKYGCRSCGQTGTFKMVFLSPKGEVEGLFGSVYFCESCVPDVNQVAADEALYHRILFNK